MAPATEPEEPVVEEYESDEFEVDDDEGDEEFQEEADDDEDEAEVEGNGQSLTSLLIVGDPNEDDEDEDDGGYAPAGETDPADEPVDGYKRALTPEEGGDPAETDIPPAVPRVAAPASLKRKTSGDEGEDEDEDEDDGSEAKKAKV